MGRSNARSLIKELIAARMSLDDESAGRIVAGGNAKREWEQEVDFCQLFAIDEHMR